MNITRVVNNYFPSLSPKLHSKHILAAVGVGIGAKLLWNWNQKSYSSKANKVYPKDTVVLHQFARGKNAPSLSPFPLKVEMYLRIHNIPYDNDFSKPLGPKGKSPWITYNDEDISDSQLILEFLNKKFNIDMNNHLNEAEKATARAFRCMMEDHLYWTVVHDRWVIDGGKAVIEISGWPQTLKGRLFFALARRRISHQCWAQGTGRHSPEIIKNMAYNDIKAISAFLGDKKYLMGDQLCEEDCSLFGFITQLIYNNNGLEKNAKQLIEECPNLTQYCDTIKNEFWSDWEKCLKKKK